MRLATEIYLRPASCAASTASATESERRALASRQRRVLGPHRGGDALAALRVVLAGSGVAGILFFVV